MSKKKFVINKIKYASIIQFLDTTKWELIIITINIQEVNQAILFQNVSLQVDGLRFSAISYEKFFEIA